MSLRPATAADFAFIRSLTQHPEYAPFISDQDETRLAAYLASPLDHLYIWEGETKGFALFCQAEAQSHVVELRRLALEVTGGGLGRDFVRHLIDHAFTDLEAKRLWLDASGENPRAMKIYESLGFTREGVLRQHDWRPILGRSVDMHLFGLMRGEWEARG